MSENGLSLKITEVELNEYRGRMALLQSAIRAQAAADEYVRIYQAQIREAYGLPTKFTVHLGDGTITFEKGNMERMVAGE
jgi:hypothetical protein